MSVRIQKLRRCEELMQFSCLIGRPDIPVSYFQSGECYGFFVDYVMVAGYCIVHESLADMYLIQQIPKKHRQHLIHEDPFKYAEITGWFLKDPDISGKFYRHLAKKLLFHKASFFVYSYLADNIDAEQCYRAGNPLRLYSGRPEGKSILLSSDINVELISYIGILKICLNHVSNLF